MEYENAVIFHLITSVRHKIVCLYDGNGIPTMNEFIVLLCRESTSAMQCSGNVARILSSCHIEGAKNRPQKWFRFYQICSLCGIHFVAIRTSDYDWFIKFNGIFCLLKRGANKNKMPKTIQLRCKHHWKAIIAFNVLIAQHSTAQQTPWKIPIIFSISMICWNSSNTNKK